MPPKKLNLEIRRLIHEAKNDSANLNFDSGWQKLGEAHIISQPYAGLHILVHWRMLILATKQKSSLEIIGQIVRLIVAGPGSIIGRYPVGNIGRSHVNMFLPQAIPSELKERIDSLLKD